MCGIFGFMGFEESGLLQRMGNVIRHRGPDGEGCYQDRDGKFSMGMTRLSIIDLESGSQPMFNEDRSIVVCFNGEIYNYVELMEELEAKGHIFQTQCDTEVIVHAYEEYGVACLEKLNGMFGFALYDTHAKRLFMARDRAGQKPLYYYHRNGRFIFASEIKAILESDAVERKPNIRAIDSYLGLRYVPQPETLFEGIHVLPAAHYFLLRNGEVNIRRYWDIDMHRGPYGRDRDYHDAFEELFFKAVKLTMRSDVPVGAYLSGGVDSSLVVAAMRRYTDKLNTFSISFGSPIDETPQARELASHLGCTHHEIIVKPQDFSDLPKAIWHLERPIGDALILAYYKLAQEAAKHVKVVLSGEGADENYAGYSFHKIIKWTEMYKRLVPGFVNRGLVVPVLDNLPVAALDKLFIYPAYLGERGKARAVDYLRRYGSRNLSQNYVALKALWDIEERSSIYSEPYKHLAMESWIKPPRAASGPFLDRLLQLQFDDWLQDNLLLRQDKNTMAHGLELRAPFLDHHLIEQAFAMPPHLKVRGLTDKFIERELGKKVLPRSNTRRSKVPFYFPLEYFYQNREMTALIELTLNRNQVRKRNIFDDQAVTFLIDQMKTGEFLYLKQVLSLVILELWYMIFMDRQKLW